MPGDSNHARRHVLVFADEAVVIRVRIEIELASDCQCLAHQRLRRIRVEAQRPVV